MNAHTATCPYCDARVQTDPKHGEVVCSECQTVITEDVLDRGPDWRTFDNNPQSNARAGTPVTPMLHDKGLSTTISWKDVDGYGNALSDRKRQQLRRLRTWDERYRAQDAQDRNLKQALGEIDRMASALGLPKPVRETASVIYRRALETNLLLGRSIEGVAASTLYAAARQEGVPRSLDEIAAVARAEYQPIARTYRYIVAELSLAVDLADPRDYLPRFASELDCSNDVRQQAHALLTSVAGTPYLSGKNPVSLAAAALYASGQLTDDTLTQKDVSTVADVTVVTIRHHYRDLLKHADQQIPD